MSKAEREASAADHAYFQALEASFIRLRGAPLLLSPTDWQVAKVWRRDGIPLELVIRVMERLFERHGEAGKKTGIRSLRYFQSAVASAWNRIIELGGDERESPGTEPVDIEARLSRLAESIASCRVPSEAAFVASESVEMALREAITSCSEGIRKLTGSAREVEGELQRLDRRLMDRIRTSLGDDTVAGLERELEKSLADLSERLGGDVRDRTLALLLRRRLREELEIPVLSLFSDAARPPS